MRALGQQLDGTFDGIAQIKVERLKLKLACFDFREVENVVDDARLNLPI